MYPEPRPRLRIVPPADERPRPAPDPELKAALDDMQRVYKVRRERIEHDGDEPEAA